ncbi:unnamed protein product [Prunus armeniaca]|uniref:NOTCH1 EGF-like calcium-binding domain-containing protein n=1 Tax=Prunus armeniaca TaxID=36596 RepID=A0A6J5TRT6_PRUAR|nr:unnamed protein product [Prunus armeniaca]
MGLDTKLLKTVLIWVMAAATTRSASEAEIPQTIRADCQYKCGEVSIPYPFGTNDKLYYTGCLSLCTSTDSLANGSCSGIGCCKAVIPKMTYIFSVKFQSFHNHTGIWDFNPCSCSFWVEEESYDFSTVDLVDLQSRSKVTTVNDWSIEQQTCKEAQENVTSYARSQDHSFCLDSDNGPGYRCSCSPGYQGITYIPNGCQDVDECADPMLNDCEERSCINQKGSYPVLAPETTMRMAKKMEKAALVINFDLQCPNSDMKSSGAGLVLLLASGGWFYLGLKKRKLIKLKKHYFQQNGGLMLQKQLLRPEESIDTTKIFTEEELKMATNNFDESRIIGRSGYGTVNHKNVIKLFGCCLETEVPLLVYEFVTNVTLSDHIQQENTNSTATIP